MKCRYGFHLKHYGFYFIFFKKNIKTAPNTKKGSKTFLKSFKICRNRGQKKA
jgi:hypothetical protein